MTTNDLDTIYHGESQWDHLVDEVCRNPDPDVQAVCTDIRAARIAHRLMVAHQHRFTIPVEWDAHVIDDKTFHAVTKLRCESCEEEVERG